MQGQGENKVRISGERALYNAQSIMQNCDRYWENRLRREIKPFALLTQNLKKYFCVGQCSMWVLGFFMSGWQDFGKISKQLME